MPFTPVTFTDGVTPLNKATFDGVQAGVIAAERTENKGAASGYAPLDASSKLPDAQLPGRLQALNVTGGFKTDCNALLQQGWYIVSAGAGNNSPDVTRDWHVEVNAAYDATHVIQTAYAFATLGNIAFRRVNIGGGWTPWLTLSPPAYGTSLPASPLDGQEAILVDSVTNPTYQWRFRYNAGSASAYKWEFVGGAPARKASTVIDSATAGVWVDDLRTNFTGLRTGDWWAMYDCYWLTVPVGQNIFGLSSVSGASAAVTDSVRSFQGTLTLMSGATTALLTGVSAVYGKWQANGSGNGQVAYRALSILPVRVS